MKIELAKANSNVAFHLLNGINRPIIPSHVTKIVNSIQRMGVVRPVVTVVTSCIDNIRRRYVLDGQHLITALQRLGMDIPYVTLQSESLQEIVEWIALLNASSRSWTLIDYIVSWKALPEKEDYRILFKAIQTNDLTPNLTAICYGVHDSKDVSKAIKKGEYSIINKKKGDEILKNVSDIFGVLRGRHNNRAVIHDFVSTYVKWRYSISNYKHEQFLEYVNNNHDKFLLLVATPEQTSKILLKFGK